MLSSIPYTTTIPETPFNVGVFLVNFHKREDGLSMGEAYCKDFDLTFSDLSNASDATAVKLILEALIYNS